MNCGSKMVIRELSRRYPEEVVRAQLRAVYRKEVREALAELSDVLRRSHTALDRRTYEGTLAKLRFAAAYTQLRTADVSTLEALLKSLVRQKGRLAARTSGPRAR